MATPFIGEIRVFGGDFEPLGWAFCDGRLIAVSQNSPLFSILGTTYGGDGRTTFALPNLNGRAPMGVGDGPGLSSRSLGQAVGVDEVTLTANQIPHSHGITASSAATEEEGEASPAGHVHGTVPPTHAMYGPAAGTTPMAAGMVSATGGGDAHENRQPYLPLNFIIALDGIFPTRN